MSVEELLQEAREIYRLGVLAARAGEICEPAAEAHRLGVSGLREAQAWQLPLIFPA